MAQVWLARLRTGTTQRGVYRVTTLICRVTGLIYRAITAVYGVIGLVYWVS
jgi:hypothetical protein